MLYLCDHIDTEQILIFMVNITVNIYVYLIHNTERYFMYNSLLVSGK